VREWGDPVTAATASIRCSTLDCCAHYSRGAVLVQAPGFRLTPFPRSREKEPERRTWVEGADRDEILRRGRVLIQRRDGAWRHVESDLDSVDE